MKTFHSLKNREFEVRIKNNSEIGSDSGNQLMPIQYFQGYLLTEMQQEICKLHMGSDPVLAYIIDPLTCM